MKNVIIDNRIFEDYPDFKRGIIIANEVENALENTEIYSMLNKEIEKKNNGYYTEHENVKVWDEAHVKFGSNPNKFPPSIKSLIKRIKKPGFPFINSVVALFNYISIKYVVPCGGDDADQILGDAYLGFSDGTEHFLGLGNSVEESPVSGEIIYFDTITKRVMCRRWNWRNGTDTKITEFTKKIIINIDGIGFIEKKLIEEARDELAFLLTDFCQAKIITDYVDKNKTTMQIN